MYDWIFKTLFFAFVIAVMAYVIPGMVMRAVRDFKRRYGKGEADGKKDSQ